MFVRAKRSVQNGVAYEYLQIVESFRDGGKPRQRVLATLGRRDELIASGKVDGLLQSLARFSEKLRRTRYRGSALDIGHLIPNPLEFPLQRAIRFQLRTEPLVRLGNSRIAHPAKQLS